MDLIITIDTEADNAWAKDDNISVNNLKYLPRFQALCNKYNYPPTYLCTYEVFKSPLFYNLLSSSEFQSNYEIGTHLHPWTTPPFVPVTKNDNYYHPFPYELPRDLFFNKLEVLTTIASDLIGEKMTSYRAGRWGFGASDINGLVDLGYKVDCSVTPLINWRNTLGNPNGEGGPDFVSAPNLPYYLSWDDACKKGNSPLLEVPMTILFTHYPFYKINRFGEINNRLDNTFMGKVLAKIAGGPLWFRPFPWQTAYDLIAVYKTAKYLKLPYVEMMIHSSELMPGGSPYYPDTESIERLYSVLENVFTYLEKDGVSGTTLKKFAKRITV